MVDDLDENRLKAIFILLGGSSVNESPIGYTTEGTPIFGSELGPLLDNEVAEAERGNYITVDELAKRK